MYQLTARMMQNLRKDLEYYHSIFQGGRCSGWELEELVVKAIKSDTVVQHHVMWNEAGHDKEADIRVIANKIEHLIQIKSGKINTVKDIEGDALVLSGYRLTRFKGNFVAMTEFLNNLPAPIIAFPHRKNDDEGGRTFVYQIAYVEQSILTGLSPNKWVEAGARWEQINNHGVIISLTENMSWQVWWKIPINCVIFSDEMKI